MIAEQIVELEKKRLITKRNLEEDKRNKQIFLTEQGKAIEENALNTTRLITKKAETDINTDELVIFKKLLHQIITNIE